MALFYRKRWLKIVIGINSLTCERGLSKHQLFTIRQTYRDGMSIRENARMSGHPRRKTRDVSKNPLPRPFTRSIFPPGDAPDSAPPSSSVPLTPRDAIAGCQLAERFDLIVNPCVVLSEFRRHKSGSIWSGINRGLCVQQQ